MVRPRTCVSSTTVRDHGCPGRSWWGGAASSTTTPTGGWPRLSRRCASGRWGQPSTTTWSSSAGACETVPSTTRAYGSSSALCRVVAVPGPGVPRPVRAQHVPLARPPLPRRGRGAPRPCGPAAPAAAPASRTGPSASRLSRHSSTRSACSATTATSTPSPHRPDAQRRGPAGAGHPRRGRRGVVDHGCSLPTRGAGWQYSGPWTGLRDLRLRRARDLRDRPPGRRRRPRVGCRGGGRTHDRHGPAATGPR